MNQKYIQFGKPLIGENEKFNVIDVLSGSQFVHGEYAKSFENNFSKELELKIQLQHRHVRLHYI